METLRMRSELEAALRRAGYDPGVGKTADAIKSNRIAVAALIFRDDGQVLLEKRGNVKDAVGLYEGVGGGIGLDDDLHTALYQEIGTELYDSTGLGGSDIGGDLEVSIDQFFDVRPIEFRRPDGELWTYVVATYLCRLVHGTPGIAEPYKIEQLRWATLEELYNWPDHELSPWTIHIRDHYRAQYGNRPYFIRP